MRSIELGIHCGTEIAAAPMRFLWLQTLRAPPAMTAEAHAGTGAAARATGIGLNVIMIRNAPSPMIHEPI